jgi:hypothetical protein
MYQQTSRHYNSGVCPLARRAPSTFQACHAKGMRWATVLAVVSRSHVGIVDRVFPAYTLSKNSRIVVQGRQRVNRFRPFQLHAPAWRAKTIGPYGPCIAAIGCTARGRLLVKTAPSQTRCCANSSKDAKTSAAGYRFQWSRFSLTDSVAVTAGETLTTRFAEFRATVRVRCSLFVSLKKGYLRVSAVNP